MQHFNDTVVLNSVKNIHITPKNTNYDENNQDNNLKKSKISKDICNRILVAHAALSQYMQSFGISKTNKKKSKKAINTPIIIQDEWLKFSRFIQTRECQQLTQTLLDQICLINDPKDNTLDLKARDVLSAYMVYYFPADTLNTYVPKSTSSVCKLASSSTSTDNDSAIVLDLSVTGTGNVNIMMNTVNSSNLDSDFDKNKSTAVESEKTSDAKELDMDDMCYTSATALVRILAQTSPVPIPVLDEAHFAQCFGFVQSLQTTIQQYISVFRQWIIYDKERLCNTLVTCHHQWTMTRQLVLDGSRSVVENSTAIASEGTKLWVAEVDKQRADIEAKLARLLQDPEKAKTMLSDAPFKVVDVDRIVREVASQKYWDDFQSELLEDPPNYQRLLSILQEIKRRLKKLVCPSASTRWSRATTQEDNEYKPNEQQNQVDSDNDSASDDIRITTVHQQSWCNDVDQQIDIMLLQQMIMHNAVDYDAFMQLFNNIHHLIASVQSASMDQDWDAWKQSIINEMMLSSQKHHHQSTSWATLLPELFNRILIQLDKIEDVVVRIRSESQESL